MQLTKRQLKKIIKEEVQKLLQEQKYIHIPCDPQTEANCERPPERPYPIPPEEEAPPPPSWPVTDLFPINDPDIDPEDDRIIVGKQRPKQLPAELRPMNPHWPGATPEPEASYRRHMPASAETWGWVLDLLEKERG